MFWGLSPALDLQEEFECVSSALSDDLNILIIGGCDGRQIIKTLAQAYRHKRRHIHFYVVDGCSELIVRQMLLLSIALEKTSRLGLLGKARMFLEVYGNVLLRPTTSRYVIAKTKELVKMITNSDHTSRVLPTFSLDNLKFRDKDYMEILLKFWSKGNANKFNVCELWENRLRQSLGVRYDSRFGVYDWDYNMRLKDLGNIPISSSEYMHFREHGVAFTWLETEVCRPNCTLAAGVLTHGERFLHRGYLGDLLTGPYVSFGLQCEDANMLKSNHGVYSKRATDISERNVTQMFYELERGEPFVPADEASGDKYNLGAVMTAADAIMSNDVSERSLVLQEDADTYINTDFARIHFLSLSSLEHYPCKSEYQSFFDIAYIGHNMINRVQSEVFNMFKNKGVVIFETRKFLLDLKRDEIKAFGQQIYDLAKAGCCTSVGEFDSSKDDFARFLIDRKKEYQI